jgi:hypothetical protein
MHNVVEATHSAPDAARLLGEPRISATADGGMRIDAPPPAANMFAALFDTMARLLRESAASVTPGPHDR